MFIADIAGVRVLYTGDYSREEDCHLRAVEIPQFSPDIEFCTEIHYFKKIKIKLMLVGKYFPI